MEGVADWNAVGLDSILHDSLWWPRLLQVVVQKHLKSCARSTPALQMGIMPINELSHCSSVVMDKS